jgi:hypothetical protein
MMDKITIFVYVGIGKVEKFFPKKRENPLYFSDPPKRSNETRHGLPVSSPNSIM